MARTQSCLINLDVEPMIKAGQIKLFSNLATEKCQNHYSQGLKCGMTE